MGGGQDRDQVLCAHDLVATKRDALHAAADRGAVVLAVCGGYQLLGRSYVLGDEEIPGIGLVDLHTIRADGGTGGRLVGNVAIEVDLPGTDGPRILAGFENHGGRTHLGADAEPLGRVLRGYGNTGSSGWEGVRRGNVLGTYLHGPCCPRTPGWRTGSWSARSARRAAGAARRRPGGGDAPVCLRRRGAA
jgi:CobQ-like glutamine amidotransferase family enzyme